MARRRDSSRGNSIKQNSFREGSLLSYARIIQKILYIHVSKRCENGSLLILISPNVMSDDFSDEHARHALPRATAILIIGPGRLC